MEKSRNWKSRFGYAVVVIFGLHPHTPTIKNAVLRIRSKLLWILQIQTIQVILDPTIKILCPFAVYYLRYAVRSFFTMSRISLADGKRAGQKVQRKIAVAVQKVKSSLLFVPLF